MIKDIDDAIALMQDYRKTFQEFQKHKPRRSQSASRESPISPLLSNDSASAKVSRSKEDSQPRDATSNANVESTGELDGRPSGIGGATSSHKQAVTQHTKFEPPRAPKADREALIRAAEYGRASLSSPLHKKTPSRSNSQAAVARVAGQRSISEDAHTTTISQSKKQDHATRFGDEDTARNTLSRAPRTPRQDTITNSKLDSTPKDSSRSRATDSQTPEDNISYSTGLSLATKRYRTLSDWTYHYESRKRRSQLNKDERLYLCPFAAIGRDCPHRTRCPRAGRCSKPKCDWDHYGPMFHAQTSCSYELERGRGACTFSSCRAAHNVAREELWWYRDAHARDAYAECRRLD